MDSKYWLVELGYKFVNVKKEVQADSGIFIFWAINKLDAEKKCLEQFQANKIRGLIEGSEKIKKVRPITNAEIRKMEAVFKKGV
jgi:hypothetical protein